MRLTALRLGQSAKISNVAVEGALGKRLMELGMTRGAVVRLVRRAPLGDPAEYIVQGAHIALRKADADKVEADIL